MIDLLKICLKEMEIELLIQRLKTYLKPTSIHYNTVMLQSQRYISVQKNLTKGFIKSDDNATEIVKITSALHEMIDEINEKDFLETENSKPINEEDIQEAVEFIKGMLNYKYYKYYTYFYEEFNRRQYNVLSNFRFEYDNGIGKISFNKYITDTLDDSTEDENKYSIDVEIPFKELKCIEKKRANYSNPDTRLVSEEDVFELIFKARNQKQSIIEYATMDPMTGTPFAITDTDINFLSLKTCVEYSITLNHENEIERLVKAFQFLMKANGAKEEMF